MLIFCCGGVGRVGVTNDTPHSERGTFPKDECRRLGLDTAGCQDREDLIRALETPRKLLNLMNLWIPSLKLTYQVAPENGWLEYDRFLLGPGPFSGAMLVSGRVGLLMLGKKTCKFWYIVNKLGYEHIIYLAGGFKLFFNVHPYIWGNDPI